MPWQVRQDNFINEAGEAGEHGDGSFASDGSKRTVPVLPSLRLEIFIIIWAARHKIMESKPGGVALETLCFCALVKTRNACAK